MAKLFVFQPPAAGSSILTSAIYPNADGGVVAIPWSADKHALAVLGGWETSSGSASGGYSFTNFDAVINAQLGYGAASVVVILQPVSFEPANDYTPNYVFTTGYATSISSPTGQLFTAASTDYPGAGTITVNTCAQGVDNTAFPVAFQAPFVTAWKAAVAAALNHMASASYASKIAYVRVGCSTGGQSNPVSVAALETQCSPANLTGLTTAWLAYVDAVEDAIIATSSGFKFDQAISGGLFSGINAVPYSFADAMAAQAVPNGFGVGSQGLQNYDITAFAAHGTNSGGNAVSGYPSSDFCYVWATDTGAPLYESQTVAASTPNYVGNPPHGTMGSLVPLIPFAIARGTTHLELYYQDWQVAYDPTNSFNATYGPGYQATFNAARGITTMSLNTLENGGFSDIEGQPLANGYLTWELSHDEAALASSLQVVGGLSRTVQLDNNGNVAGSPQFQNNDTLTPAGSFYIVNAYRSDGTKAWRAPQYIQVLSTSSPFNLSNVVPYNPPVNGLSSGSSSLIVQTNSTNNASQTLLNFVNSASVTFSNPSGGEVTATASSGTNTFANRISFSAAGVPYNSATTGDGANSGMACAFVNSTLANYPNGYSASATQPAYVRVSSSSITTSGGFTDQSYNLSTGVLQDWLTKIQIVGTTDARYWFGISDQLQSSIESVFDTNTPAANFVGFRWASATDTNFQAVCQTSSSNQTVVNTGVAPSGSAPQTLEFSISGGTVTFLINGVSVGTISTHVPSTSTGLTTTQCVDGYGNSSTNMNWNFYYVSALLSL